MFTLTQLTWSGGRGHLLNKKTPLSNQPTYTTHLVTKLKVVQQFATFSWVREEHGLMRHLIKARISLVRVMNYCKLINYNWKLRKTTFHTTIKASYDTTCRFSRSFEVEDLTWGATNRRGLISFRLQLVLLEGVIVHTLLRKFGANFEM